ncbi:hypothetical protein [Lysobacter sp. F6437]|uniref:hypothetical protein n=1 Tax=Lysobacter sp. F6437 TaxID=3459296 RepID=UPI00403E0744
MNTRTRNLLMVALATALAAPVAVAQTETTQQQLDRQDAAEELPPQVNPNETADQPVDPRLPVADEAEDPMSAVPPPARSDAQSTLRTDVAPDRWTRLDADADGRISKAESAADAEFSTGFAAMDSDGDGFVSRAEFDAGQGSDRQGVGDDSMDHDGMDHEGMHDRDRMDDDGTGNDSIEPTGTESVDDRDGG